MSVQSVYSIERRGNDYIARDHRNKPIGVYDTAIEAARAVGEAAEKAVQA